MKKRLCSCLLVLALLLSMVPSAFAASGSAPYSVPIVGNIAGTKYLKYADLDDTVFSNDISLTQRTLEVYSAFDLYLTNKGDWAATVKPFRDAFKAAGYQEDAQLDSNGQEKYWFGRSDDGVVFDVFIILGEKASQSIMNESGMVYIEHDRALYSSPASLTNQQAANALHNMGLFQGTGTDANGNPIFDLDRAPNRYEAVTMLVGLLGKSEAAKKGTWDMPFTDVAEWAKPYVGYAYANGLTAGTSATTYGGNATVSASEYLTFVLRSLGYQTGTDFQWDKAWVLSDKLGMTHGQYNASIKNFTRGDVALISYASLFQEKQPMDYTYLAAADFRSVRRQYPSAKAQCGYAYEYTDLNGDQCVITVVAYKIISNYSVVTLHNLTKNTTITDPSSYYEKLSNRAWGQERIDYMDLNIECLENENIARKAMLSVYQGGSNTATGRYASADFLNK